MRFSPSTSSALALLASTLHFHHAAAQVHTDCQPLNRTDCPPNPAFSTAFGFNFNATPKAELWETTVRPMTYSPDKGAIFTISKQGESPTIRSKFYIFFGRLEFWLKTSPGTGIISSMMMLSDDLDEIDWEFFGTNNTHASTNYFGKGQQDFANARYHPVPGGLQADYRNYTTVWTKDALDFYIDGAKVRTLLYKDANNGQNYPQTPMRISFGIWAGGDPRMPQGTREWAGGDTDYSKVPFSMFIRSAHVTDFSSGKEYSYSDKTGSFQSIRIAQGNSSALQTITAPPEVPPPTIAERWEALAPGAKIAIYASSAGVVAAFLGFMLYYCIKQRRRGAREAKLAEERQRQERLELEQFKKAGVDPDSFAVETPEYRVDGNKDELYKPPVASPTEKPLPGGINPAMGAPVAAMRSPVPFLGEGAQSPRVGSPGPAMGQYKDGFDRRSPGPMSPAMHSPAHGGPAMNPAFRSFTSPNPQMRQGSPAPSLGGYGNAPRTQSPAPTGPQRSFTADPYRNNAGYGGQQDGGYGANNQQGYWR